MVLPSDGYQPIEFEIPKRKFEEVGHTVLVVSDKKGTIHGKNDEKTTAAISLKDFDPSQFDAVVFVGGPGSLECLDNDLSYRVIQNAVIAECIVAAICLSARVVAKSGVLAGKKATGWNDDFLLEDIFREHGVMYVEQPVVTDGHFVTATGPAAATEFAQTIIELL
jgi:protease I